jgi:nicotinate-nucleotide adenylyltransferase
MNAAMPDSPPQHIALFGGSFDPPHTGHTGIAGEAVQQAGLDQVIFIPCRQSPLKQRQPGASAPNRMEMLRLATGDLPWATVSDFEISRPGPSYSWETVQHFASLYPAARLYWLLGADQWQQIDRWANPDYLREKLTFLVFCRDGQTPQSRPGWQYQSLGKPSPPATEPDSLQTSGCFPGSSTEVRERLANGDPAEGLLHPEVASYALRLGLYRP